MTRALCVHSDCGVERCINANALFRQRIIWQAFFSDLCKGEKL